MTARDVIVLGAGVGGLAAAAILARGGAHVRVFEQAPALGDVGAGVQISPNGGAVLKALGLGGLGDRSGAVVLRNGADARQVLRLDLARRRPDHDFRLMHRADLIGALYQTAMSAGAQVQLGCKVSKVDLAGDRPIVTSAHGQHECELLVGADGLHSIVRAALNGPAVPFFAGQVAWRAMIPCESGDPSGAEVFMGPGRHLVSYSLRGGTLRNIVAVQERKTWTEESWSVQGNPNDLRQTFEAFDPKVRGWLDQAESVGLWGLFRHDVATCWGRALPHGAVAILGDAVHPTLPFLAQGANLALEDAYVLAGVVAANPRYSDAVSTYHAARVGRVTRAVTTANGAAKAYHLREPLRGLAHVLLRATGRIASEVAMSRLDWLYGYDVTSLAVQS